MTPEEQAHDAAVGYYGNYQEYNKLLRTWFVAFGIGGPVLFYSRPDLLQQFDDAQRACIIWAFLVGSPVKQCG